MASEEIVVVAAGVIAPSGLSVAEVDACVRAGTMRFSESAFHDARVGPFQLAEVPEEAIPKLASALAGEPSLTPRDSRLLRLASGAVGQAVGELGARVPRPPLFLGLPETQRARPVDPKKLIGRLSVQAEGAFDLAGSDGIPEGRHAALLAVSRAAAALRSGGAKLVLAGGVDSYVDLYTLGTLDMEGRTKAAGRPDGFVPGEGAAVLALSTTRAAEGLGLRPIASVSEVVEGREAGHLHSKEVFRGDGLATVLTTLLARVPPKAPVRSVFSSMNGESHWAKEWGVAAMRCQDPLDPACEMSHPADVHGDTGAATGALLVALACLAVRRDPGAPALVYASADHGGRAALLVGAPGRS